MMASSQLLIILSQTYCRKHWWFATHFQRGPDGRRSGGDEGLGSRLDSDLTAHASYPGVSRRGRFESDIPQCLPSVGFDAGRTARSSLRSLLSVVLVDVLCHCLCLCKLILCMRCQGTDCFVLSRWNVNTFFFGVYVQNTPPITCSTEFRKPRPFVGREALYSFFWKRLSCSCGYLWLKALRAQEYKSSSSLQGKVGKIVDQLRHFGDVSLRLVVRPSHLFDMMYTIVAVFRVHDALFVFAVTCVCRILLGNICVWTEDSLASSCRFRHHRLSGSLPCIENSFCRA